MTKSGNLTKNELRTVLKAANILEEWANENYQNMAGAEAKDMANGLFAFYIEQAVENK